MNNWMYLELFLIYILFENDMLSALVTASNDLYWSNYLSVYLVYILMNNVNYK